LSCPRKRMDYQSVCIGRDKHVPPKYWFVLAKSPKDRAIANLRTFCQVMPLLGIATTLKGALFQMATSATIGRTPHGTTPW